MLLNLAAHKDIQDRVCEELFEVLDGDLNRSIEIDDLPKLKYMDMVLKESLRLYSTVPIIAREITKDIQMGMYMYIWSWNPGHLRENMIPGNVYVCAPTQILWRNIIYYDNNKCLFYEGQRYQNF